MDLWRLLWIISKLKQEESFSTYCTVHCHNSWGSHHSEARSCRLDDFHWLHCNVDNIDGSNIEEAGVQPDFTNNTEAQKWEWVNDLYSRRAVLADIEVFGSIVTVRHSTADLAGVGRNNLCGENIRAAVKSSGVSDERSCMWSERTSDAHLWIYFICPVSFLIGPVQDDRGPVKFCRRPVDVLSTESSCSERGGEERMSRYSASCDPQSWNCDSHGFIHSAFNYSSY